MKPSILATIEFPCSIGDTVWVMHVYRKCRQCGGKKIVTIKGKRWCCRACNPDGQQMIDTPVKGQVIGLSAGIGRHQHRQVLVEFSEWQGEHKQLREMNFNIDSDDTANHVYATKSALLKAVKPSRTPQPGYCSHRYPGD